MRQRNAPAAAQKSPAPRRFSATLFLESDSSIIGASRGIEYSAVHPIGCISSFQAPYSLLSTQINP